MLGTILSLIFSKAGGLIAAALGLLFLLWGKKRAERRAARAERQLAGAQTAAEAQAEHARIDQEVQDAKEKIADSSVDQLIDGLNRPG